MDFALTMLLGFSLLFIVYTYAIYPCLIAVLAWLRPRPAQRRAGYQPTVSIVVAAHNEAANLPGRVANLLALDYPPEKFEVMLVSDGSTDTTAGVSTELAARHPGRVRALPLAENGGKAVALNAGVAEAGGELIVFADARQRFAPDVLARLAENFADPAIGSVSGELMFTTGDVDQAARDGADAPGRGVAAQVGLYWRYEKWMRRNEGLFASMLGATGAIYAIRRTLYTPLPAGTLLDDFLTPMRIVLRGSRAIFEPRAVAWDRPSEQAAQEFRRKVRTLAGNYQAIDFEPRLLRPWDNPVWWQLWSHKLFRLWVPFAMAGVLAGSLGLAPRMPGWWVLVFAQGGFYAMAGLGWVFEHVGRPIPGKLVSLAYTFCVLNAAAAKGLYAYQRARDGRGLWRKAYVQPAEGCKADTRSTPPQGGCGGGGHSDKIRRL